MNEKTEKIEIVTRQSQDNTNNDKNTLNIYKDFVSSVNGVWCE